MLAPYLARPYSEVANSPVPPNIEYFLDHGICESDRWFVPLVLRLRSDVTVDDVRSVLTAVTNQHEALRLELVERAGVWEQHIATPREFTQLATRTLPPHVAAGSAAERRAILAILAELVAGKEASHTPVAAAYIAGDGRCVLAIAVNHMALDTASHEILMTDIATAFGQRLAGEEIALEPVTTTWREWSQRCAALATHPAILESRDFWLENSASATLRAVDHEIAERPRLVDVKKLSAPLTTLLTAELDGAQAGLGVATEEILLASLGRTIARTIGEGVVGVDLLGSGRSVLEPYVDLHRSVGWFATVYPVPLTCANTAKAHATEMLGSVHRTLAAVPDHGIGHGLLRYVYAPTAMQLSPRRASDILFSYVDRLPEPPSGAAGLLFDVDTAMPVRDTPPGLGHALELRAYRADGVLQLDWWYDTRRLDRITVEELAEQFSLALIDITSEAASPMRVDSLTRHIA